MSKKLFQVKAFINTYNKKKGYTMVWIEEEIYVDIASAVEAYKRLESRMKFQGSCYKGASGFCRLKQTEINDESKGKLLFNDTIEESKY